MVGCGTTGELEEGNFAVEYSTTWYSENGKAMGRKRDEMGMMSLPSPVKNETYVTLMMMLLLFY
jgi:hypothetical protein